MTIISVLYPVPSLCDEPFQEAKEPRFTLGEFVHDPFNPHSGNEMETRAMLVDCGVPFVDSLFVRASWSDPLPAHGQIIDV